MISPTRIATKLDPERTAKAVERKGSSWELQPDEPFDSSRRGGSGHMLGRLAVLMLACLGGAWAIWGEPARWREWIPAGVTDQISAIISRSSGGPAAPPAASPPEQSPANRVAAAALAGDEQPALELRSPAVLAPAEPAVGEKPLILNKSADTPARPAAPAIGTAYASPDPGADLLVKRAAAAGLHPDISRALLQRLSDSDFQNAGVAVQKAVAETADDAVFSWPRQRRPELALFQVYFVAGAAPDCRRYVVIVTKDAWSTTALPMERCGVKPVHSSGKSG